MSVVTGLALAGTCLASAEAAAVSSPDGRIRFEVLPGAQYRVGFNGQAVIEPSTLGIFADGVNLASGAKEGKAVRGKTRQSFTWFGHPEGQRRVQHAESALRGRDGFCLGGLGVRRRRGIPLQCTGHGAADSGRSHNVPSRVWKHRLVSRSGRPLRGDPCREDDRRSAGGAMGGPALDVPVAGRRVCVDHGGSGFGYGEWRS